jgi:hypothetical protein
LGMKGEKVMAAERLAAANLGGHSGGVQGKVRDHPSVLSLKCVWVK